MDDFEEEKQRPAAVTPPPAPMEPADMVPGSTEDDYVDAETPAPAPPRPPDLGVTPSAFAGNAEKIADYDARLANFNATQAARAKSKEIVKARRQQNAALRQVAEETGAQFRTDAEGNYQPVIDPDTGKQKFTPRTSPVRYDEKGKPYQVKSDETGARTIEDPDKDAEYGENPDDPTDPLIYRKTKATPWQPIDPEEALKSPDKKLVATAARILHKRELNAIESQRADLGLKLQDPARPRALAPKQREELVLTREALSQPIPRPVPKPSVFGFTNQQATAAAEAEWMQQEKDRAAQLAQIDSQIAGDDERTALEKQSYDLAVQAKAAKDAGPAGYLARRRKESAATLANLPPDQAAAEVEARSANLAGQDQEIATRSAALQQRAAALQAEMDKGVTTSRAAEIDAERANIQREAESLDAAVAGRNALAEDTNAGLTARREKEKAEVKARRDEMRKTPDLAPLADKLDAIDADEERRAAAIERMPEGAQKEAGRKALAEDIASQREKLSTEQRETVKKQFPDMAAQEARLRDGLVRMAEGPEKEAARAELRQVEENLGTDPDYITARGEAMRRQGLVRQITDIDSKLLTDRKNENKFFRTSDANVAAMQAVRKEAEAKREKVLAGLPDDEREKVLSAVRSQRAIDALSISKEKLGFLDKMGDIAANPAQLLPFVSSTPEIAGLVEVRDAALRIESGNSPSTQNDDMAILAAFTAKNQQERSILYNVADTLSMLPAFAGELALTGGLYTAGKAGAVKGASAILKRLAAKEGAAVLERLAVEKLGAQGAKALLGQLAVKSAAGMAGAAVQLPFAGGLRIASDFTRRTSPQIKEIAQNKQGEINFILNPGEEPLQATLAAAGNQYVEIFSERAGGAFDIAGKIIGKAVPKVVRDQLGKAFLFGKWMEKNAGAKPAAFGKFLKEAGWNGVINEVLEERVGDAARGFADFVSRVSQGEGFASAATEAVKGAIPSGEQWLTELIAFSIPGLGIQGINALTNRAGKTKLPAGPAIRPEQIAAVNVQIDTWQPPAGLTPEAAQTERLAARAAVKLIAGRPMESLLAEERTAIESKLPDKSPRMEDVNGVPVITKGQLSRLAQVAPETANLAIRDEASLREQLLTKPDEDTETSQQQGIPAGPEGTDAGALRGDGDPASPSANSAKTQDTTGPATVTGANPTLNVPRGTAASSETLPPLPVGKFGALITPKEKAAARQLQARLVAAKVDADTAKDFASYYVRREGTAAWNTEKIDAAMAEFDQAGGYANPLAIRKAVFSSQKSQQAAVKEIHAKVVADLGPAYKALSPAERKNLDHIVIHRIAPELITYAGAVQQIVAGVKEQGGAGVGISKGMTFNFNVTDMLKATETRHLKDIDGAERVVNEEIAHLANIVALSKIRSERTGETGGDAFEVAMAEAGDIFGKVPKEVRDHVRGIYGEDTDPKLGMEFFRMLLQRDIAVEDGKFVTADGVVLTEQTMDPDLVESLRELFRKLLAAFGEMRSTLAKALAAEGRPQAEIDSLLSRIDEARKESVDVFRNFQKQAYSARRAAYESTYAGQPPTDTTGRTVENAGGTGTAGRGGRGRSADGGSGSGSASVGGGTPAGAGAGVSSGPVVAAVDPAVGQRLAQLEGEAAERKAAEERAQERRNLAVTRRAEASSSKEAILKAVPDDAKAIAADVLERVQIGDPSYVLGANRERLPASYIAAAPDTVQASHAGEDFHKNPLYGGENTRPYHSDETEQNKVRSIALPGALDEDSVVTDAKSAADGPAQVVLAIFNDTTGALRVSLQTAGGNGREQGINLAPLEDQERLAAAWAARGAQFGLADMPEGWRGYRFLGVYDLRDEARNREYLQLVDKLNPNQGVVQDTAARADIDAALNIPVDLLLGISLSLSPEKAKEVMIGLVRDAEKLGLDRNLVAGLVKNPAQAQFYIQRLLIAAAFRSKALGEFVTSAQWSAGHATIASLIRSATETALQLRAKGHGNIADAIGRTLERVTEYAKGGRKLNLAISQAAEQQEIGEDGPLIQQIADAIARKVEFLPQNKKGIRAVDADETQSGFDDLMRDLSRGVELFTGEAEMFGPAPTIAETLTAAIAAHFRKSEMSAQAANITANNSETLNARRNTFNRPRRIRDLQRKRMGEGLNRWESEELTQLEKTSGQEFLGFFDEAREDNFQLESEIKQRGVAKAPADQLQLLARRNEDSPSKLAAQKILEKQADSAATGEYKEGDEGTESPGSPGRREDAGRGQAGRIPARPKENLGRVQADREGSGRPGEIRRTREPDGPLLGYQRNLDAQGRDPRLVEEFPRSEWTPMGVPVIPKSSLSADHPLLQETAGKSEAVLTKDSLAVRLLGLKPGKISRPALREAIVGYFMAGGNDRKPLSAVVKPAAQENKEVLFMGGGGGSGKSSMLKRMVANGDFVSEGKVLVNPDEIRDFIPEYEVLTAMGDGRGSARSHQEAADIIAAEIYRRARQQGLSLILDGTMKSAAKGVKKMRDLRAEGYFVRMLAVTIDPHEAMVRGYLRGKSSGRFVPDDVLLGAHQGFNAALPAYIRFLGNENVTIFDNSPAAPIQLDGVQDVLSGKFDGVQRRGEMNPDATTVQELLASYGEEMPPTQLQARGNEQRLAPNGKPSKLSPKNWESVRTPEFKAWFGDWEKFASRPSGVWEDSTGEVSKVVDENGEPLVVFHGSEKAGFDVFDPYKAPSNSRPPSAFFTDTRRVARTYSGIDEEVKFSRYEDGEYDEHRAIYGVFLNIRNPWEENFEGANWDGSRQGQYEVRSADDEQVYSEDGRAFFDAEEDADAVATKNDGAEVRPADDSYFSTNSVAADAVRQGNDGAIMRDVQDDGGQGVSFERSTVFAVFSPYQVKSATDNSGAFDPRVPSILQARRNVAAEPDLFAAYGTALETEGITAPAAKAAAAMQDLGVSAPVAMDLFGNPLTIPPAKRISNQEKKDENQPATRGAKNPPRKLQPGGTKERPPDGGMGDLFSVLAGQRETERDSGVDGQPGGGIPPLDGPEGAGTGDGDKAGESGGSGSTQGNLPDGKRGGTRGGGRGSRSRGSSGKGKRLAQPGSGLETDRPPVGDPGRNITLSRDQALAPKGTVSKLRANLEALRIIKAMVSEGRLATAEEKQSLVKFSGWGALSQAFDDDKADRVELGEIETRRATAERQRTYGDNDYNRSQIEMQLSEAQKLENWKNQWFETHQELKSLLTEDEYRAAKRSTINAHFTSPQIVAAMWDIAQWLGFKGGNVLEPGAGIGHFFGLMPEAIADRSRLFGVELDSYTAKILKALYPEADIQNTGFQKADIADNSIDLAISNVPFANVPVADKALEAMGGPVANLHDYFFGKTLTKLKPGGTMIFITSAFTMDKGNPEIRKWLAERADLVAAYRLPNNAFKDNAGTDVVTDIIVLRKKDGKPFPHAQAWTNLDNAKTRRGEDIRVNEYFAAHPGNILGQLDNDGSMFAGRVGAEKEMTVHGDPNRPPEVAIQQDLATLPQGIMGEIEQTGPVRNGAGAIKMGNIVERDGKYYFQGQEQPDADLNDPKNAGRVRQFLDVRNALNRQYDLELSETATAEEIEDNRRQLNEYYDSFKTRFSEFHDRKNKGLFIDDPDYFRLLGAEVEKAANKGTAAILEWAKRGQKREYVKADIFSKRVLEPRTEPTTADTLEDAFGISLGWRNQVDTQFIADLLGQTAAQVESALITQEIAVRDPETGRLFSREQYLSGNVRRKLDIARSAGPDYARNVRLLEEVQPQRVGIEDIRFGVGATWIPAEIYNRFLQSLGVNGIEFVYKTENERSEWEMVRGKRSSRSGVVYKDYETNSAPVEAIMDALLNLKAITINKSEKDGGGTDHAATTAAREKAEKLEKRFVAWVRETPDVSTELTETYNQEVNSHVQRTYDGQFLSFPWANKDFDIYPDKKNTIWRAIQEGFGLIAHGVGGGKTIIGGSIALEMRRLGMARKPMIVVHNATLEGFAKEISRMAPTARVLVGRKDELGGPKRKEFLMRIAAGDWDAVVIAHSTFGLIEDDPDVEIRHSRALVDEAMATMKEKGYDTLAAAKEDRRKPPSVKALVKQIERLEGRIDAASRRRTDTGLLNFQQLGVDALIVDEVHEFKKMPFSTQLEAKGIDGAMSARAHALFMRARQIQEKMGGKNVFSMTGTPVTNTLGEIWNMMRLVAPNVLKDYKVELFDQFVSKFAKVTTESEMGANGDYKNVDRLSKFVNLPEWATFLRQAADVKLGGDLVVKNRPGIKGGSPELVSVPRSKGVAEWVRYIRGVLDDFSKLTGEELASNPSLGAVPVQAFMASRAAAIDIRLIEPRAKDEPGSKVNRMIGRLMDLYRDTSAYNGTQVIFADSFNQQKITLFDAVTPSNLDIELDPAKEPDATFNLYEDIRAKLIAQGVPADQIAVITDSKWNNDKKKQALFEMVNEGKIRVIIGSTKKLGTGVNMQQRMIAAHHLDVPWTPAELEQRDGRVFRQGNIHGEMGVDIELIRYGMEDTLDAALWQKLETKQRFAYAALSGKIKGRELEEDKTTLNLQEQRAVLSGKYGRRLWEINTRLDELRVSRFAHTQESDRRESEIANAKSHLGIMEARFARLAPSVEKMRRLAAGIAEKGVNLAVDGQTFETKAATAEAVKAALDSSRESLSLSADGRQTAPPVTSITVNGTPIFLHPSVRVDSEWDETVQKMVQRSSVTFDLVTNAADADNDLTFGSVASPGTLLSRLEELGDTVDSIERGQQLNTERLRQLAGMGAVAPWEYQAEYDALSQERVETEALYAAERGSGQNDPAAEETPQLQARRNVDDPNQENFDFDAIPEDRPAAVKDGALDPLDRFRAELPQAMAIASGFTNIPGVDQDEIRQSARLALADAARKFDAERGNPFSAYAGVAVRNRLRALYRKEAIRRERFPLSLDETVRENELETRGDFAEDTETPSAVDGVALSEGRRILESTISELPDRMQQVVRAFYANERDTETADRLGITKQAVGNLKRVAFERLRGKLGERGVRSTEQLLSRGNNISRKESLKLAAEDPVIRDYQERISKLLDEEDSLWNNYRTSNVGSEEFSSGARFDAIQREERIRQAVMGSERYKEIISARDSLYKAMARKKAEIAEKIYSSQLQARPNEASDEDTDEIDALLRDLDAEIPAYQAAALAEEAAGGQKKIGRPDLAFGANNADVRGADQYYTDNFSVQSETQWQREADAMLARDYAGTKQAIETAGLSGQAISPAQTKAAEQIATDLRNAMLKVGTPESRAAFNVFWIAFRGTGTAAGRALAARRDPLMTPAERYRDFLMDLMLKPRPEAQKEIDNAKTPEEKAKLIDAETAALLEKLKAAGISVEDILKDRVTLSLQNRNILDEFIQLLARAAGDKESRQRAFRMILKNRAFADIAKATGMAESAVRQLKTDFIAKMRQQHFAKFQAGAKADADSLITGAKVDDATAEREFTKWLGVLGIVSDAKQGRPKFNIEDPAHVMRMARAIQSATRAGITDMLYEWWIMNILSGPQTHVVNIAGNSLNAGWDMTVQRGMEALVNLAVRDSKAARLGEFKWLIKGLLPGMRKGLTLAARAWSAEHDFFEHTVLGTPLEIDSFDKAGNVRAAIPGKTGRVVRVPGRALLFADSFFKSAIGQAEVAAVAYRMAKAEGLSGKKLTDRVALLSQTREEVIASNLAKARPTDEMVEYFAKALARKDDTVDADALIANRTSPAWEMAREQTAFDMARAAGWTDEAWQRAVEKSKELTFQQDLRQSTEGGNPVEDLASKLQEMRGSNKLLALFFPFVRTPYNVFRQGIRKSPLGTISLASQAVQGLYAMKNGKPYLTSHPELVRDLSEQLIAWTAMALLFAAAQGDDDDEDKPVLITGSMPYNMVARGQRELQQRAYGGDYVVRIGGRNGITLHYGRYEPFATVLGTTIDTIRAIKSRGATADNLDALYGYMMAQAQSKTFLQGFSDISKALEGSANVGEGTRRFVMQAMVPNIIRQPLRNLDDYVRDTKHADAAYQALPAASLAQPKTNIYGGNVMKGGNPVMRLFFSTPLAADAQLAQADALLLNWNRANPAEAYAPQQPGDTYKRGGKEIKMTAEEYRRFSLAAGRLAVVNLRARLNAAKVARPTKEDVETVRKAFEDARTSAKERMFR